MCSERQCFCHLCLRQRGSNRETTSKRLGRCQNVGCYTVGFMSIQVARSPDPGLDLIQYHQSVVLITQRANGL